MIVWVVETGLGNYSSYGVVGVFDSKEAAKNWVLKKIAEENSTTRMFGPRRKLYESDFEIESWEVQSGNLKDIQSRLDKIADEIGK